MFRICLASTERKDRVNFPAYCKETKVMYVGEVGFYPVNPTIHKVFDHTAEFLSIFPSTLSTGMTSEEPAESANKDIKSFQLDHAFQGDPQRRNLDTFHRLMDRSCPAITAFLVVAKLENRAKKPLRAEALALMENSVFKHK